MTKHEIMKAYVEEKVTELVGSLTSFNFANAASVSTPNFPNTSFADAYLSAAVIFILL